MHLFVRIATALAKLSWGLIATVGTAVCLTGASFLAVWLWRVGWLDRMMPKERVANSIHVRLHGPTLTVRGETFLFEAVTQGDTGTPHWSLIPAHDGALRVLPSGKTAEFRSLEAGIFTLMVSVAGDGQQVASDHIQVENLNLNEPPDPKPEPMQQAEQMPPPLPTIGELTLGALDNVASEDRAAEARVVAGSIKSVISRIETGLLPPDADPMREVEQQAKTALGSRAGSWSAFLVSANLILDSLRSQGDITTAASTVPALSEMADALLSTR